MAEDLPWREAIDRTLREAERANGVRPWGLGLTTTPELLDYGPWPGRCDWNLRTGCITS